jgi:hypothetical protein
MSLADSAPPVAAGHFWHLIAGVVFLFAALLTSALTEAVSKRRALPTTRTSEPRMPKRFLDAGGRRRVPLVVAAVSAAGAGAVHVTVIPEHFHETAVYGVFFIITAAVQFLLAAALYLRPSYRLLAAGAAGNACLIALWLTSRLVGIPLGPEAGSVEAFGPLDILASSFELAFVLSSVLLARRPSRTSGASQQDVGFRRPWQWWPSRSAYER